MVEVEHDSFDEIASGVKKILDDFGIYCEPCDARHVSIAYVIGDVEQAFLTDIISEISEDKFHINPVGIKILEGKTIDKDFITVELDSSADFEYACGLVEENCEVKKFEGKFTAHVSLFKVEKGSIHKKDWFNLSRFLEIYSADFLSSVKISGKKISVYNPEKQKEIEVEFKNK